MLTYKTQVTCSVVVSMPHPAQANICMIPGVLCLCYHFNRLATEHKLRLYPPMLDSCFLFRFVCMMEMVFSSTRSRPKATVMDRSVIHTFIQTSQSSLRHILFCIASHSAMITKCVHYNILDHTRYSTDYFY